MEGILLNLIMSLILKTSLMEASSSLMGAIFSLMKEILTLETLKISKETTILITK